MTWSRSFTVLCQLALATVALTAATGCQPALSPPFDTMKGAQMTVYRLQNYVPPASAQPAPAVGGIQLPPQIQQWITAGASLLPPGLLPPGLLPGTSAVVAPDASRFPAGPTGFPILSTQQVMDPSIAGDILDTLGHPSSFQPPTQSCMYAELGIRHPAASARHAAGRLPRVALLHADPGGRDAVALPEHRPDRGERAQVRVDPAAGVRRALTALHHGG